MDDDGATPAEDTCDSSVAITGTYSPSQMFSGFNTLELSGNWTLTVFDLADVVTGSLISWCLDPTTSLYQCLRFLL